MLETLQTALFPAKQRRDTFGCGAQMQDAPEERQTAPGNARQAGSVQAALSSISTARSSGIAIGVNPWLMKNLTSFLDSDSGSTIT